MQASKIIPGKIYAVKRGDVLLRFRVSEVNTITKRRAEHRSPHDSSSEVVGFFLEKEGAPQRQATLEPDDIAGEYTQYTELVARQKQEKAEAQEKQEASNKRAHADRVALYAFVGVEVPLKSDAYDQMFRYGYGEVHITKDGIRALADRIQSLKALKQGG